MTGSHLRRGAWCIAVSSMALAASAFNPNIGNFVRPHGSSTTSHKVLKTTPVVSHKKSSTPVVSKTTSVQKPLTLVTVSGNIAPNVIEIEEGVANNATKVGTNLYPRTQSGADPVLALPQFANDALKTFLGFGSNTLLNTPLLNTETQTYVDWVKDSLVNSDPASVTGAVATGIVTGVSGTTYNAQKRGHWNGARIIDGVAGAEQDQFIKGGKEDDTSTWTIGSGSIGSSKYDTTQAYIANTGFATNDLANFPTGRKNVLYFGMERRGNNGTTAFDFEFNQLAPLTDYIPNRSEGDVLFTFEMTGSGSSGSATPHIYLYHNGNYLSNEVLANSLPVPRRPVSSINQTTTPSAPWGYVDSQGNWTIGQIPNFSVAEAAVPFGVDFLTGVNGCGGQAFVQIRTRSSVTNTSDLKDTTKFFVYSFGGPTADMQLQSNCGQTLSYSGAGSHDSNGGGNLTYNWSFHAPAGVTLSSSDPELAIDAQDSTHYTASFTSDSVRNISVGLPIGVDYADITAQLNAMEGGGCSDGTDTFTVRVWRTLDGTATLTAPCSTNHTINYSSTATGGKTPYTYSWTFYKKGTPDVQVGTSSTASGSFNASSAGDYYGVLVIHDSADTSSDSHVVAKPSCQVSKNSNQVTTNDALAVTPTLTGTCSGYVLTYGSNPTGGNGTYVYEWKFFKKGTPDTMVGTASDKNGTFTASSDGDYYATLKVTDTSTNACSTTGTTGNVTVAAPMNPAATKDSANGTNLTVTLKVTYHAPATVQWQKFVGGVWVDIAGGTNDTLTYSSFETDDTSPQAISYTAGSGSYVGKVYTVKFRAKTHRTLNGGCDATSNEVTVTKTIGVDP